MFLKQFLSIHPFQDGNGRLSRLLTTLLLLRQGYLFIQYVSFERLIEERKKEYYQALISAQQRRYTKEETIEQWTLFFLECMESLVRKLEAKYSEFSERGAYLNDRQKQIKDFIADRQTAKVADIGAALPTFSLNTIKKDVAYMVAQGVLEKSGDLKGAFYEVKKTDKNGGQD